MDRSRAAYDGDMGHVIIPVEVSWRRRRQVRAVVDTGATFLVIPRSLAEEIGVPDAIRQERLRMADGTVQALPQTTARVRVNGREVGAVAVIVPSGEVLVGAEVLEALGMMVDPSRRRLVPSRSYAARLGGYRKITRRR